MPNDSQIPADRRYLMSVMKPSYSGGSPYSPMWAWDRQDDKIVGEWERPTNWRDMHIKALQMGFFVDSSPLSAHKIFFESEDQINDFMMKVDWPAEGQP